MALKDLFGYAEQGVLGLFLELVHRDFLWVLLLAII